MYSKPIIGNGIDCELVGWTLKSLDLNGASTFSLTFNHGKKGQWTKFKYVQKHIRKTFVRFRKWNTLESNFSIPSGVTAVGASAHDSSYSIGNYASAERTEWRVKNAVTTKIRSRNHMHSALMWMTDFTRACSNTSLCISTCLCLPLKLFVRFIQINK